MVGFPCFNVPSTFFGGLELLLVSKHMHRGLNRPSGHNVMRCMGNSIRAKLQQKSNTSICCFQSAFESEVCQYKHHWPVTSIQGNGYGYLLYCVTIWCNTMYVNNLEALTLHNNFVLQYYKVTAYDITGVD